MLLRLGEDYSKASEEEMDPEKQEALHMKVTVIIIRCMWLTPLLMKACKCYTVAASEPANLPEAKCWIARLLLQQANGQDEAGETSRATLVRAQAQEMLEQAVSARSVVNHVSCRLSLSAC